MRSRITVMIKSWDNLIISFLFLVITVPCFFPTFLHGESIQQEPSRWKIVSVVSASDSDNQSLNQQQQQHLPSHLQPKQNPTLHSNLESTDNNGSNLNQARASKNRFKSKDPPIHNTPTNEFKRAYNSNSKKNHRPSSIAIATSDDEELRDSEEYNDNDYDDDEEKLKNDDADRDIIIIQDQGKVNNRNRNRGKKQPGVSTTTKSSTSINNQDKKEQHNIDIYNEEDDEEEEIGEEDDEDHLEDDDDDQDQDDYDDDMDEEEENNSDTDFGREDLIDVVTELERDAQIEEQSGLLPQVLGLFGQGTMNKKRNNYNNSSSSISTLIEFEGLDQLKFNSSDEDTNLLPEDLSELSEDIVDDIAAGVEESLLLSDRSGNLAKRNRKTNETEMRQFPMYLFQGQYMPEPRLNRFIDGAIRNMGSELRIDVMDPLYFRVLPRGRVESRPQPVGKFRADLPPGLLKSNINNNNNSKKIQNTRQSRQNRFFNTLNSLTNKKKKKAATKGKSPKKSAGKNRGVVGGRRRRVKNQQRRRKPGVKRQPNNFNNNNNNNRNNRRRKVIRRKPFRRRPGVGAGGGGVVRRRRPNGNRNRNKNRNPNRNKKKRPNKKRPGNNKKNKRQKRRVKRNVGGGRVEGLSNVQRDGDAEMQAFGNYTLVRSHMKMGPVELSMQFRTRRGLRRTGATLPVIRMHTVTRVSMEGSEMIDFLLDRPHPESIKIRGKLFPLAQRIARNIFARLFLPNSFLTSRLREKSALALLSKPKK